MKRLLILTLGLFFLSIFYSNASDSTKYVGGQTFYLSGGGISSTATSVPLTSFRLPQRNYELSITDFGSTVYVVIESGKSKQEYVTCTGVTQSASATDYTASLTGCTRGLLPFSPYTASSTYAFPHSGGSSVIVSDTPQFFNTFANLLNDEAVSGAWTFTAANPPRYASTPALSGDLLALATVGYANNIATQGVATSSYTNAGIVELATQTEMASGTAWGADEPHAMSSQYATSSPSGTSASGLYAVVSKSNGKLSQSWLDLSEAYTWTGAHTFSSTSTFNGLFTTTATSTMATTTIAALTGTGTTTLANLSVTGNVSLPSTPTKYKTVQSSRTASGVSETITYTHNLGILPKRIKITATRFGATAHGGVSVGIYLASEPNDQKFIASVYDTNFSSETSTYATSSVLLYGGSAGNYNKGYITNVGTSTFDIVWTAVGTPTQVNMLLFEVEG